MADYHKPQRDVKLVLALLAALIVAAFNPGWLARPVVELIPADSGIRLDWLSHLKARLLGALTLLVKKALRRGRPVRETAPATDHAVQVEMDRVRQQYVRRIKAEGKGKAHEWLVEAYRRMSGTFSVGKKDFCAAAGVAVRSFRFWSSRMLEPAAAAAPAEPPAPSRPRGEGRFDLEKTLPGIQTMADTTDWEILGVPLKVMAVQDPGNRHRQILGKVVVAERESGQKIISIVDETAPPGTQAITDRGTPYMSQAEAMAQRELEHAPCKEFSPTEKATLERAFGIVKQALAPLVEFLEELAGDFPGLRSGPIAVKLATLLLNVCLHVYHAGHRDLGHPLEGGDPELLRCIAEEQLEKARSDQRSKLSTLERIHGQYAMTIGKKAFIRIYRRFALDDIVEAEQKMRWQACNGTIHCPHQYLAAVINDVAEKNRERRRRLRIERKKAAEQRQERQRHEARLAALHAHPAALLFEGLARAAEQWRGNRWLLEEVVCGQSMIACAVERMAAADPLGFDVEAYRECRRWHEGWKKPGPPLEVLDKLLAPIIERRKVLLASN